VTTETQRPALARSIGLLILRLGIGGYMLTHGWGKLEMLLAGEFAQFGDPIGLGNRLSLVLVVMAEFVCPLLVMLGLLTRIAAVPTVFSMGVAAFVVHGGDPWSMAKAAEAFFAGTSGNWFSKEPALLFLIPFLALVFTGPGCLSLDRLIRRRRSKMITRG
jgi:putative oxidoreductase